MSLTIPMSLFSNISLFSRFIHFHSSSNFFPNQNEPSFRKTINCIHINALANPLPWYRASIQIYLTNIIFIVPCAFFHLYFFNLGMLILSSIIISLSVLFRNVFYLPPLTSVLSVMMFYDKLLAFLFCFVLFCFVFTQT